MSNFFEYSQHESTESNYNEFETERENFLVLQIIYFQMN